MYHKVCYYYDEPIRFLGYFIAFQWLKIIILQYQYCDEQGDFHYREWDN